MVLEILIVGLKKYLLNRFISTILERRGSMGQYNRNIRCRRCIEDQIQALIQVLETSLTEDVAFNMSCSITHSAVRSHVRGVRELYHGQKEARRNKICCLMLSVEGRPQSALHVRTGMEEWSSRHPYAST